MVFLKRRRSQRKFLKDSLLAKRLVHARSRGQPGLSTFGSNRPAKSVEKLIYKIYNIFTSNKQSWGRSHTTKISVLEKQSTITPTNLVSVMPLQR